MIAKHEVMDNRYEQHIRLAIKRTKKAKKEAHSGITPAQVIELL